MNAFIIVVFNKKDESIEILGTYNSFDDAKNKLNGWSDFYIKEEQTKIVDYLLDITNPSEYKKMFEQIANVDLEEFIKIVRKYIEDNNLSVCESCALKIEELEENKILLKQEDGFTVKDSVVCKIKETHINLKQKDKK